MRVASYQVIEELLRNDRQVLCRARQPGSAASVLLKSPITLPAGSGEIELLRHELEILEAMSVTGVPKPLGLSEREDDAWLSLEDPGGVALDSIISSFPGNLKFFFKFSVQLCVVLAEIHRVGVIHRRICPQSLLVEPGSLKPSLLDFSMSWISRDGAENPAALALTQQSLPYFSPEQTGRMNRRIDHRTDLYSLGITLYELLTGAPPFRSVDQLELIHWHMAKEPAAPHEIDPRIPLPVSQIVLKLLAKTPEERYQSARGVGEDLEICAQQWANSRAVTQFSLGRRDFSDRFEIPQRLYGREREVQRLSSFFEETCHGCAALALVAGYPGVGKTSLIQQLYRPIARQKGYFLSGKFDQVVRNIPYGALIQAFRALVRQLLAESDERLARWRQELHHALGASGGVLTEVIPELELILGKQPPPPPLGSTETQNRFQLAFQNFLGVLAREEHPLVIFLDDLQWADAATLSLLERLLTNSETRFLLLIGAYRDNEVDPLHPLMRTAGRLESAGAEIRRLGLGPLSLADLTSLVADTLHLKRAGVESLAQLVLQKTDGNPFFVIQFLKTLWKERLLTFDYDNQRWGFRLDDIAEAGITANVVDLMISKIQSLSPQTQRLLPMAACIGNEFSLSTLSLATNYPEAVALAELQEALREGLIFTVRQQAVTAKETEPEPQLFAFLHDRVQQAAYALLPEEQKKRVRLRVGRLLLERWDAVSEEGIFDLIEHLNFGSALMTEQQERQKLVQLNRTAARKAKSSTAFDAALRYIKAGLHLLSDESWESDYELMFELQIEAGECEYLCGDPAAAKQRFGLLLARARTPKDTAEVHHLRLVQYETMSRYAEALQCGREGLAFLGVTLPNTSPETQVALEGELVSIQSLLAGRSVDTLVDLPAMADPEKLTVMRLLTSIWAPAYITGNPVLTRLISATMVRLSLQHGSTEESAYGYVTHAITVGPILGDYRSAYEWGKLALSVDDLSKDHRQRAKIHQQFHAHVNLWRKPLGTSIPHAREACRSGLETGDFNYAGYGAFTESWSAFLVCGDLERFIVEQSSNLALLEKLKMTDPYGALRVIVNWARALQGKTAGDLSLSDQTFDEEKYRAAYGDNAFFMTCYYVMKGFLCLTFAACDQALEAALRARQVESALRGTIWPVLVEFLHGISLTALYRQAGEVQQEEWMAQASASEQSLRVLAENCPENFGCFASLLRAELARLQGRDPEAVSAYEEAIRLARSGGSLSNEALANEIYSRFWKDRGNPGAEGFFLHEARRIYAVWGAKAKVRSLEESHPGFFATSYVASMTIPPPVSSPAPAASLDLATVAKASGAISQEMELQGLLQKLMKITLENAGAQRGFFFNEENGRLFIQAEGVVDPDDVRVLHAIPAENRSDYSHAVVQYVHKTRESVVLGNAGEDERFGQDPYVASAAHLSILCVPVVNRGNSQGILYLENSLAGETFTPDRIRLMHMLASQAAISLQNALLYREVRQEAASRQHAEEMLRSVVEGTASVTGADFFRSLVQHLAFGLGVRYAFVTECRDPHRAKMLAFWTGEQFGPNAEYDPEATPCRNVLAGETSFYPQDVQQLFPGDTDLVGLNASSYLGIPMFAASGEIIGHLAVLDEKPMEESPQHLSVLKIFAARAAAELERLQADIDLRAALAEVERLKNRLQAENIYLQEEIQREHNFEEIVGSSRKLMELLSQVEQVAPTGSTVLIYGETGTGKELIARAIHDRSERRGRPLVKVNCGAISAGLVESELFGHVKGAFTGALDRRTGRFELANGGTIFLDEVGELPPETQVKLLRVLQEQEFEPVGSSRTMRVDVRVIAATNRDLEKEVASGRFRADLYYRLNVLPLRVPSLRERRDDIPQMVRFFLARFSRRSGKTIHSVTQETMNRLMTYSWPGNVRELQNIIERAFVLSQGPALVLGRDLLPVAPNASTPESAPSADPPPAATSPDAFLVRAVSGGLASPTPAGLEEVQKQHILSVLRQTAWVIEGPGGAAKLLQLHPNTLRSRMKKLGIQRSTHEIS